MKTIRPTNAFTILACSLLVGVVVAQVPKPSETPENRRDHQIPKPNKSKRAGVVNRRATRNSAPMAASAVDPTPIFSVVVDPSLNLDPDTMAIYQQMAAQLNDYPAIPNDRTNYYSAVNSPPDYIIAYWEGIVRNVQANGGGYQVTVSVIPNLSSTDYGPATTIPSSDYTETYWIANGNIQYVGFSDPNGLAGQFPDDLEGF